MYQHIRMVASAAVLVIASGCTSAGVDSPPAQPVAQQPSATTTSKAATAQPVAAPPLQPPLQDAPNFAIVSPAGHESDLQHYEHRTSVVLLWFDATCTQAVQALHSHKLHELRELDETVAWFVIEADPRNSARTRALNDKGPRLRDLGWTVRDKTNAIAASFGVENSPFAVVVNDRGKIVYRGGLEVSKNGELSRQSLDSLADAIDDVENGPL